MLGCFEHVERMDEGHWIRKAKAAKVKGQQRRGRPRFGWLDGVKGRPSRFYVKTLI